MASSSYNPFLDGPNAPRHSMITGTSVEQIQNIISTYKDYGYIIRYSPSTEKDDSDMLITFASYEQLFPCLIFIHIRHDYNLFKNVCKLYGGNINQIRLTNPGILCYDHTICETLVSGRYSDILSILKKYNTIISNKTDAKPPYNPDNLLNEPKRKKDLCRAYGLYLPKIPQYSGNITLPSSGIPSNTSSSGPTGQSAPSPKQLSPQSSSMNDNDDTNQNNDDNTPKSSTPAIIIKREPMPFSDIPEDKLTEMQKVAQLRYLQYWKDKDDQLVTYRAQQNMNDQTKKVIKEDRHEDIERKEKQRQEANELETRQHGYSIRLNVEREKLRRIQEEEDRVKNLEIIRLNKEKEAKEHELRLQTFRAHKDDIEEQRRVEALKKQSDARERIRQQNAEQPLENHNTFKLDDNTPHSFQ